MSCPECDEFAECIVDDEYYDEDVHVLTMNCGKCDAKWEEHYTFDRTVILSKGKHDT